MGRDLGREFLRYLRVERGLSPNTLEAYERDLKKLVKFAAARGRELVTIEQGSTPWRQVEAKIKSALGS